jgi:hypothetical protein
VQAHFAAVCFTVNEFPVSGAFPARRHNNPDFRMKPFRERQPIARLGLLFLLAGVVAGAPARDGATPAKPTTGAPAGEVESPPLQHQQPEIRIAQLAPGRVGRRRYGNALPSLLRHVREHTTANVVPEPILLADFEDDRLFSCPFLYVNFADRTDWTLSDKEVLNLKNYLERGGFLFIEAGINAAFLRDNPDFGQHHSFGEWNACPEVKAAFEQVFPGKSFQPLKRSHPLFRVFYEGLPDTSILPATVRQFVEQEKWPDGTYSAVALTIKGRMAVLVTPIIAMGWGKNSAGGWSTTIRFRVRESAKGLDEYLRTAAYSGARFEVVREDDGKDVIYCQKQALPAWANEPGGKWRVFRYYGSREISDFAHIFYTRLGTDILIYALTH